MAVASSLARTFSLVTLRQASFSAPAKPSLLSFPLHSPNLSLRLSLAPSRRFFAAPPDSDGFEPEEDGDGGEESEYTEPMGDLDETIDSFVAATGFVGDDMEEGDGTDEKEGDGNLRAEDSVSMDIEEKPKVTIEKPRSKSSSSAKRGGKKPTNYQIRIKLKSYWVPLIEDSCKQIIEAARTTNAKTMGPVPLPTKKRIYCVLKSPHKHKDAREHFEIRTHQRLIEILQPTADTIDSLMQIDFPAGVNVQVKV